MSSMTLFRNYLPCNYLKEKCGDLVIIQDPVYATKQFIHFFLRFLKKTGTASSHGKLLFRRHDTSCIMDSYNTFSAIHWVVITHVHSKPHLQHDWLYFKPDPNQLGKWIDIRKGLKLVQLYCTRRADSMCMNARSVFTVNRISVPNTQFSAH